MEIEAKQYAKMEIGGLFVIFEKGEAPLADRELDWADKNGSR
jgi:hypothetical protein